MSHRKSAAVSQGIQAAAERPSKRPPALQPCSDLLAGLENQLALAPLGGLGDCSFQGLGERALQLIVGGEDHHHTMAFLEHNAMAFGNIHVGVFAQTVDSQLDVAELQFKLAAFATGQYCSAKMIA